MFNAPLQGLTWFTFKSIISFASCQFYLFVYLFIAGGGDAQFLHPISSPALFSHSLCSPTLNTLRVEGCGSLDRTLKGFLSC